MRVNLRYQVGAPRGGLYLHGDSCHTLVFSFRCQHAQLFERRHNRSPEATEIETGLAPSGCAVR